MFLFLVKRIYYAIAVKEEHAPENDPPEELLATLPAVSPPIYAVLNDVPDDATLPAVSPPLDVENTATCEFVPLTFSKER